MSENKVFNGKSSVFKVVKKGKVHQPINAGSLSELEVGDLLYLEYPFKDWTRQGRGFYSPKVQTHVFINGEWSSSYGYLTALTKSLENFTFEEVGDIEDLLR